jgi:MSHA biogenesis protein MshL
MAPREQGWLEVRSRNWVAGALVLAASAMLVSCETKLFDDNIDPYGKLSRADFERLRNRQPAVTAPKTEPPIPALQSVLATPQQPLGASDRLVSISVTDTVPLKDVLIELARRAEVDLQMDPRISGGIVFSAREQPLVTVLERICDLAGLRFTIRETFLRIELDEPYYQNYRLDVLNLRRNTTGSTSISTNVFASVGASAGGANNNSVSQVSSESVNDLWVEVERNLGQIMANSGRFRALAAPVVAEAGAGSAAQAGGAAQPGVLTSPLAPLANANTPLAALGAAAGLVANRGATGQGQAAAPPAAASAAGTATAAPPGQAAAAQPAGPQSQAAGATAAAAGASANAGANDTPPFSVNRSTGIISIYGTKRQQELARNYIDRLRRQSSAQVLIEGRIVEVTLNEEFRAGINWRTIAGGTLQGGVNFAPGNPNNTFAIAPQAAVTPFATGGGVPAGVFTGVFNNIGGDAINLAAVVQAIETFGTLRTLSSPRLTVLNNQTAILKVAQNQVYFTSTVTAGTAGTATTAATAPTVSSTANTVPIGLVMSVQPIVDFETGTITMTLRPTVSRIVSTVSDPGVEIVAQSIAGVTIQSLIPVVEVREIDSVLKMQSGNLVVLGGLMRDDGNNQESGVPGLKSLPLIGNLFKSRTQTSSVVELVILLRATIVDNSPPDPADMDLYRRYNRDPRPLSMN